MSLAILNQDRIVTLTTDPSGTEIGNLPVNTGLDELRFDGTSLITISDTTAVTSFYVEETAEEGFILHVITDTGWQLVSMTWDDRNNLINDAGTIRVKTPAELQTEEDALSFDSGIVQSENIIERQIDYTRKIPTDILITDKEKTAPNSLNILYNNKLDEGITYDSTSFVLIDSTADIDFWVQYRFPNERIVNNIYLYGTFPNSMTMDSTSVIDSTAFSWYETEVFFSYSLNGTDWTYLSGSDSTSAIENTLYEYDNFIDARLYALIISGSDAMIDLFRGVSAKYFRLHFRKAITIGPTYYEYEEITGWITRIINSQDVKLTEMRFNEVISGDIIYNDSILRQKVEPDSLFSRELYLYNEALDSTAAYGVDQLVKTIYYTIPDKDILIPDTYIFWYSPSSTWTWTVSVASGCFDAWDGIKIYVNDVIKGTYWNNWRDQCWDAGGSLYYVGAAENMTGVGISLYKYQVSPGDTVKVEYWFHRDRTSTPTFNFGCSYFWFKVDKYF